MNLRKACGIALLFLSLASCVRAEDLSQMVPLTTDDTEKAWKVSKVDEPGPADPTGSGSYIVGVNDVLNVSVLQPDPLQVELTVSPDGTITFPYIGNLSVKGKSLIKVQYEIQNGLADYMKYPLVSVSLKESRSQMFYVYGEVVRPGAFALQEGLTVLRAISLAGGFTKFGSASKVKILRSGPKGNETIKVDLKKAMEGDQKQDVKIIPGDVVTISEGVF